VNKEASIHSASPNPAGTTDWFMLLAVLGLMFFSIAFVYSASAGVAGEKTGSTETFFWSHAIRVMAGIGVLVLFSRIDYHWIERWSKPTLIVSLALLLYVLFDGTEIKGATRWVSLGFISFQPSELAKFALVIHLGVMLSEKKRYIESFRRAVVPMLFWVAMVCGLIALQPNLSTAATIFVISMMVLFMGRVRLLHLLGVVLTGLATLALYAISAPYRMQRILTYMSMHGAEGGSVSNDSTYQLTQGLIAFGSGGVFGVGPGQSRQRLFVPEPFGDFIFSIIGEEYGLLGTLTILVVFALITWRGLLTARMAPDDLGRNVAGGVAVVIGLYAILNAAVTTGMIPTTGLPMPFVSYGGSAVLFSAAALGVLLNISRQAKVMTQVDTEVRPAIA